MRTRSKFQTTDVQPNIRHLKICDMENPRTRALGMIKQLCHAKCTISGSCACRRGFTASSDSSRRRCAGAGETGGSGSPARPGRGRRCNGRSGKQTTRRMIQHWTCALARTYAQAHMRTKTHEHARMHARARIHSTHWPHASGQELGKDEARRENARRHQQGKPGHNN